MEATNPLPEPRLTDTDPSAVPLAEQLQSQIRAAGMINQLATITREYLSIPDDAPSDTVVPALLERRSELSEQDYLQELYDLENVRYSSDLRSVPAFSRQLTDLSAERIEIAVDFRLQSIISDAIEPIESTPFDTLQKEALAIRDIPALEERLAAADECESKLHFLLCERQIFTDDTYRKPERVLPENLSEMFPSTNFIEKTHSGKSMRMTIGYALEEIRAARLEKEIIETIGTIDENELALNRHLFGAKGANLLAMQKLLPALNIIMRNEASIPPFQLVPISLYNEWKSGKDIRKELETFYESMQKRAMHVRSSAEYSEDSEVITGAGIYESIAVSENASFEEFFSAVETVYRSVEAAKAAEYRAQNGITQEERMGLVIQETVIEKQDRESGKAYINSMRPYAPALSDIIFEEDRRNFIVRRNGVRQALHRGGIRYLTDVLHYQIETQMWEVSRQCGATKMAELGALLEQHYKKPVQIECFAQDFGVKIVQVRVLPSRMLEQKEISFPGIEALYESDAIGIGDMELDVLPAQNGNNRKTGLVIFQQSYFGSNMPLEQVMPAKGAVIILSPSRENGGHIETLCAEKGLLCVFCGEEGKKRDYDDLPELIKHMYASRTHYNQFAYFDDFAGHKRVRIVADGMKARVYGIKPAEA